MATEVKYRRPQGKKWSIQKCFVILGAPRFVVYRSSRDTGRKTPVNTMPICHYRRGGSWTLYNEYTGSELRKWADDLFKGSMLKYHPDTQNPRRVGFYTRKCQEVSEAKKILQWHEN
jgi:hypothetical protein